MKSKQIIVNIVLGLILAGVAGASQPGGSRRPNLVVIFVDDLGYADLGCQGSDEVLSPNIDSIARCGLRCTSGYVTAPQCSPSRAGLLTGTYQQRFGHEANPERSFVRSFGLQAGRLTIADRLRGLGYRTVGLGKWDQGSGPEHQPWGRGFDEYLGFYTGSRSFLPLDETDPDSYQRLRRGPRELVDEGAYMTDVLTDAAVDAIERNKERRFFLYLAYNAPHWPMEAKPEHLAKFGHVRDLHRRTFLAMMSALDEGVGRVLSTLRRLNLEEETLVFFVSDNGGPTGSPRPFPDAEFQYGQNTSLNAPLRGVKGEVYEGGIRVPFLVQWKGTIPAGKTYDQPVSTLDIVPTALAAAGAAPSEDKSLDGVDLLPYLVGAKEGTPHEVLYWRWMGQFAARRGPWKLVKKLDGPFRLHNLASDVGEAHDVAAQHSDVYQSLKGLVKEWNAGLTEPLWRTDTQLEWLRKAYGPGAWGNR